MKKMILLLAGFWFLCITTDLPSQNREQFVREYKIGAKDLLEIKVFELPELSQTVRVSEDGSIRLPLLGRIEVNGLTKDEVEAKLSGLLTEGQYVNNAQVSVFISEFQSQRVSVIGAVGQPGMYELIGQVSLLQIISQAGGLTTDAGRDLTIIREGPDGIQADLAVDLGELLFNRNEKWNVPLQPKDVIYIPADRTVKIFVFGEVNNPGALAFKMSEQITLLQAIAQAGGPTKDAKESKVTITRKGENGEEIKITVNLKDIIRGKRKDIPLVEGDVVFVPESFW